MLMLKTVLFFFVFSEAAGEKKRWLAKMFIFFFYAFEIMNEVPEKIRILSLTSLPANAS